MMLATIHGDRAEDFRRVFGTRTVPVTGSPFKAWLPGFTEPQWVFELDLQWVQREGHRAALIEFLAERFDQPPDFVDRELERIGMPILASDCTVHIGMVL